MTGLVNTARRQCSCLSATPGLIRLKKIVVSDL
jgi:hypothetical protein